MSDAAAAPAPVQAKTPTKKAARPKKPAKPVEHPAYNVMITAAIGALKERGGSSRQALLKYIMANYKVGNEVTKINARIKTALKAGVKSGTLKQAKGTGATGSFRLGEKKVAAAKPKPKKVKKPKAAGTAAKKPRTPKKAAAKKPRTPKKAATGAAKPKKAAASKKATTPKKAAKPKKATTPKPKKAPAKKAAAAKPKKPKTPKKAAAKKAAPATQ